MLKNLIVITVLAASLAACQHCPMRVKDYVPGSHALSWLLAC